MWAFEAKCPRGVWHTRWLNGCIRLLKIDQIEKQPTIVILSLLSVPSCPGLRSCKNHFGMTRLISARRKSVLSRPLSSVASCFPTSCISVCFSFSLVWLRVTTFLQFPISGMPTFPMIAVPATFQREYSPICIIVFVVVSQTVFPTVAMRHAPIGTFTIDIASKVQPSTSVAI